MKISVLNECFLKTSHVQQLQQLGEYIEYKDTTSEELAIERLKDTDIAIVDGIIFPATKNVLQNANNLKLLVVNTTGFDTVDLETAKQKGIKVANVGGYATEAVAESSFALMLSLARKLKQADAFVRSNILPVDPGHREHQQLLGFELKGKTLGVVGLGNIGERVAQIGIGFGMNILGFNRSAKNIPSIKQVPLEELLKASDIVSLHLALSNDTQHLITGKELSLMKPTAVIINTARGKLINETDLYQALVDKKIAGAGLDVLDSWSNKNPLFSLENVVLSPHCAFFTQESLGNLADIIVDNVFSFINGAPKNIVN